MKKLISVLLICALALFVLAACSSAARSAIAWCDGETLVYTVRDTSIAPPEGEPSADYNVIGTLTVTYARLNEGETATLANAPDTSVKIETSKGGTHVTNVFASKNGETLRVSECILDGDAPRASYSSFSGAEQFEGKDNHSVVGIYDGRYFNYTFADGASGRLRYRDGDIDNHMLYSVLRCYPLETTNSLSFNVFSPMSGGISLKLSISTTGRETISGINLLDNTTNEPAVGGVTANCTKVTISKADAPAGTPFEVYFTPHTPELTYKNGEAYRYSYRIPVKIVENNITYSLSSMSL